MTVIYDGKLVVDKNRIDPCCAGMHMMVLNGLVYLSASSSKMPTMAIKMNPKKGMVFRNCPFCGAKVGI